MAQNPPATPEEVESAASAEGSSLSAAEQIAIAHAQDHKEAYGRKWRKKDLTWTVINAEPLDDGGVRVRLTYRPAGGFKGRSGEEYMTVAPNREVTGRTQVHSPQESFPWLLAAISLASVVAAAVLVPLILTEEQRSIDPLYVAGRILWMRISEPNTVAAVQYTNVSTSGDVLSWEIAPEKPNTELAVVKVTLFNQQTNQAVVVIDEEAARLVTEGGRSVKPLNSVQRSHVVSEIDPAIQRPGFAPLWETKTIRSGERLTGMLVFEVPRGAKFKEFRWRASDSMVVRFS